MKTKEKKETSSQPLSAKSDEMLAYYDSLTTIKVIYNDGRVVTTSLPKLNEHLTKKRK